VGDLRTDDFNFVLPPELVAQFPLPHREQSRLLVFQRVDGRIVHRSFPDLVQYFEEGDLLILNNSRVIPARLRGVKKPNEGQVEILLFQENAVNDWWALLKPGKRVHPGTEINLFDSKKTKSLVWATVTTKNEEGHCRLKFRGTENVAKELHHLGEIPLPPYIARAPQTQGINDAERYQTVFAESAGSVAAPTAGLHFSNELLIALKTKGVEICFVTLHVGLGTFAPVKTELIQQHVMHEEKFSVPPETIAAIEKARRDCKRIFAGGTTSLRALESVAAENSGRLVATEGRTRIFIFPPFRFQIGDALLTNFHLPQSTLLMLVSAFAAPGEMRGRNLILGAYSEAIRERYRFFSYGDAMLIL
jgi:S-adenosylmethionine:tRNA ribosyltransferase-isomerase